MQAPGKATILKRMMPKHPEHIVMATDLGPASASAFQFAGGLAEATGAKLTIFHAIAPLVFFDFGGWDPQSFAIAAENQKTKARHEIEGLCSAELDAPVNVAVEVRECSPVQGILQFAEEVGADLLVLGSHAWGPVASVFLGSVTQGVLHQSPIPVTTVRPGIAGSGKLRTILCPIDSSASAQEAASQAIVMAAATGADLNLLPLEKEVSSRDSTPPVEWQPGSISLGVVRPIGRKDQPSGEIVRYAGSHAVDLVIMGTRHGRFRDTTTVGTTTARMIREAPCAVMAVPTKVKDEEHQDIGAA